MSDNSGYKLRDLLPEKIDGLPNALRTELQQHDPKGALGPVWGFVGSTAVEKLTDALDIDLIEVLANGWGVARELREYTDPVKHPPGKRSIVYVGKHKFTTALNPTLEIMFAGHTSHAFRFTLELTATFKAVALGVENGRIVEAGSGAGEVSAQLKYRKAPLHAPLAPKPINFPGHVKFKAPGIAIRNDPAAEVILKN